VLDGALKANGMVSFARAISAEDAEAVRAYVVDRAIAAKPATVTPPAAPAARQGAHGG
jgi:quinohemoprotein ethanol dehydrogenase